MDDAEVEYTESHDVEHADWCALVEGVEREERSEDHDEGLDSDIVELREVIDEASSDTGGWVEQHVAEQEPGNGDEEGRDEGVLGVPNNVADEEDADHQEEAPQRALGALLYLGHGERCCEIKIGSVMRGYLSRNTSLATVKIASAAGDWLAGDGRGSAILADGRLIRRLTSMYFCQIARLFVGVRYIRLNLESRNKFPLLEMGGGVAYVGRLFWVGQDVNNTEAENKSPLLDIVDCIWYGTMLCRRKTTEGKTRSG